MSGYYFVDPEYRINLQLIFNRKFDPLNGEITNDDIFLDLMNNSDIFSKSDQFKIRDNLIEINVEI